MVTTATQQMTDNAKSKKSKNDETCLSVRDLNLYYGEAQALKSVSFDMKKIMSLPLLVPVVAVNRRCCVVLTG